MCSPWPARRKAVVSSSEETGRRLVIFAWRAGENETRIFDRFVPATSRKFGKCWQIFRAVNKPAVNRGLIGTGPRFYGGFSAWQWHPDSHDVDSGYHSAGWSHRPRVSIPQLIFGSRCHPVSGRQGLGLDLLSMARRANLGTMIQTAASLQADPHRGAALNWRFPLATESPFASHCPSPESINL